MVTRKRSRWKSDTMSRNAVEVHWDRYVAKLWKFCKRLKKKQDEELPLRRLRNLKGHPKSLRHYAVKGHVKLKYRQAKEV